MAWGRKFPYCYEPARKRGVMLPNIDFFPLHHRTVFVVRGLSGLVNGKTQGKSVYDSSETQGAIEGWEIN